MATGQLEYDEWKVGEKEFDAHRMDGGTDVQIRAGDVLMVKRPSHAANAAQAVSYFQEQVHAASRHSPRNIDRAYFTYGGDDCWCLYETLREHATQHARN